PLGLLAVCSALAAAGLICLSKSTGLMIFAAATLYGVGKTFFWPTTLGVVSEQFPKGGALTINAIAGVGLIAVGVLGNPLLGALQDKNLDRRLAASSPALHGKVAEAEQSKFGFTYRPLDKQRIAQLNPSEQAQIESIRTVNNQNTLAKVALLPSIMFVCYIGLILFFRLR